MCRDSVASYKTVSHVLSFQTKGGDVCLGVEAYDAVPPGAVAWISKFPSARCKFAGSASETEASQALKEVSDQLQKENAKGLDRNANVAKDNTDMWDRWTLPCCALTTRNDKKTFGSWTGKRALWYCDPLCFDS